jgi:hypothetical protein
VHHASGAADAEHALGVRGQHAAHGYQAVLLLFDGLDLLSARAVRGGARVARYGGARSKQPAAWRAGDTAASCAAVCDVTTWLPPRAHARAQHTQRAHAARGGAHLDAEPVHACLQALLEVGEGHRGARHQRRLLQENLRLCVCV